MDKSWEYDLKNFPNVFRSLWYLYPCVISFKVIWRLLEWKSKTLVHHLANLTNSEMKIPNDESLGTSPFNKGKLTIGNPKPSRLLSFKNAGMNVADNDFIFKSRKEVSLSEVHVFALFNWSSVRYILVKISKLPLDFVNRKCYCGQIYRIIISLS